VVVVVGNIGEFGRKRRVGCSGCALTISGVIHGKVAGLSPGRRSYITGLPVVERLNRRSSRRRRREINGRPSLSRLLPAFSTRICRKFSRCFISLCGPRSGISRQNVRLETTTFSSQSATVLVASLLLYVVFFDLNRFSSMQ